MAITGITQDEYKSFLSNGGSVTVLLDKEHISKDSAFEDSALIRPILYSGFELHPSPNIADSSFAIGVYLYGDDWARIITFVYRSGGRIIYRKANQDKYEAVLELPEK